MAQRYVRVKTLENTVHYGLLQLNRTVKLLDAPPWLGGKEVDLELNPDQYELLAPCNPSKIVAVGKNYPLHAAEMGTPPPDEPLIFLKPPTTLNSHNKPVIYPKQSHRLDYEGELALVIGDRISHLPPQEARSKIWGYTIANDITARDLQIKDEQWTRAKGFDTFCPLGPWIVREISVGAYLKTFVNDETEPRQCASIQEMLFSPEVLVSYISQIMTLVPGDVILTGTPSGIAGLQVGDRIRVEIEGIGSLENYVILE